jgi:aminocarboxymuconate-semialdehyde decarboxylase
VLGTDYPFPLGEAVPGSLIESLADMQPDVRRRLLAENALEFLGL